MKNELNHLGQEKKKKSNSLQLKKYKISGGEIGRINQAYGTTDGLTPQQIFNKKKAAAAAAAAAAAITQPVAAQNNQIVAAVENVLNNSTKKNPSNTKIANTVVNVAQAVAANVAINQQVTKNNNNKTKYIELLTSIRNGITNILPKE